MGNTDEHILSFRDALRLSGPLAFNAMVKPVGALCNLDCTYCYYLDKSHLYAGKPEVMSHELLERVIVETFRANETDEVTFEWHGGEPLAAGLDFFRKVVELQSRHACGKRVYNTLQTNGTLLTPQWAKFLRDNDFLVGISIDGPRDLHDRYRKDRGGQPTFDRVMKGLFYLHQAGVRFNTMTAVSNVSEGRGAEVYEFLKQVGSRYMQFMPVVEHIRPAEGLPAGRKVIASPAETDAHLASWSVSSLGFGQFMCDIFDVWLRSDVGEYYVNLFDATLANWCGVPPGICVYGETCGGNPVIEYNGDVYPCDHFVYSPYRLGNVAESSIKEMAASQSQLWFGVSKRNALPDKCLRCRFLHLCHGECPKHRFDRTSSGQPGLNSLCEGYRLFYGHTAPYMQEMKRLLEASLPPALIMKTL